MDPHPHPSTPNPQGVLPTILQQSYTKGTPCPHPLPPTQRKYHPPSYNTHTPTILQHSYTKGTHHPHPLPQPTGSTTHYLTTLIHPQSYNTDTLKGPPAPHPPTPSHRKYHPPSYNTHKLKGPPAPHPSNPNPQGVLPTILQHSYTHNLITLIH